MGTYPNLATDNGQKSSNNGSGSEGGGGDYSGRTPRSAQNYLMTMGTAALVGGQKSTVYMGSYGGNSAGVANMTKDGIPWLVLDADSGLVLSQYVLGTDTDVSRVQYNTSYSDVNYSFWSGSNIRSYLNGGTGIMGDDYGIPYEGGALTRYFSDAERNNGVALSQITTQKYAFISAAQHDTSETAATAWNSQWSVAATTNILNTKTYQYVNGMTPNQISNTTSAYVNASGKTGTEVTYDKLFLLDYADLMNTNYGFANNPDANGSMPGDASRVAYLASNGSTAEYWWTRGSGMLTYLSTPLALSVYPSGLVQPGIPVDHTHGIRPAFNLDKNAVLFMSNAESGKTAGALGALVSQSGALGSSFKLTIKDSNRSAFTASLAGRTVTYSGAVTGQNEAISAIIVRDGAITYYGNLATDISAASGTASIQIPSGFDKSQDKIYIFNEHLSGDNSADYASELIEVTTPFAGNGTETSPYELSNYEDLLTFSELLLWPFTGVQYFDKHFILTADINADERNFTSVFEFWGTLNGNGKTISNLVIEGTGSTMLWGFGLFNSLGSSGYSTVIKNLTLSNVRVDAQNQQGNTFAGVIAGRTNYDTLISNVKISGCAVSASSLGTGAAGGLIGIKFAGSLTIADCAVYNTQVNSSNYAGGIVGDNNTHGLSVTNSAVGGEQSKIEGAETAGGIIGNTETNDSIDMGNVFATGSVTGPINAGGLIGQISSGATAYVSNGYFAGSVTGANVGGIFGTSAVSGTFQNLYYDKNIAGTGVMQAIGNVADTANVKGLTTNEMANRTSGKLTSASQATADGGLYSDASYGFVGNAAWGAQAAHNGTYYYPNLTTGAAKDIYPKALRNMDGFPAGDGSQANPYRLRTYADLVYLSEVINNSATYAEYADKHYLMENDIDCADLNARDAEGNPITLPEYFTPIGVSTTQAFKGTFDGGGYTIKNFKIVSDTVNAAMFTALGNNAQVKNITFKNAEVTGLGTGSMLSAAVLAGYITANNVVSDISVYDSRVYSQTDNLRATLGAIVGGGGNYNTTNLISNCLVVNCLIDASATLDTATYVGAIMGHLTHNATVTNCGAVDTVVKGGGNASIGGIIGYTQSSSSEGVVRNVENVYSNATLDATAAGLVAGGVATIGGIVGNVGSPTAVSNFKNAYFAGTFIGQLSENGYGGIAGNVRASNTTFENCFYDKDKLPQGTLNFGTYVGGTPSDTGMTTADMVNTGVSVGLAGVAPFNNTDIWATTTPEGNKYAYPYFKGQSADTIPWAEKPDGVLYGKGTEAEPYVIYTYQDLKTMSDLVNGAEYLSYRDKHYKLMTDIDAEGKTDFVPIGNYSNSNVFFGGTFDGNNRKIENLTLNVNTGTYAGLFGVLSATAEVKDFALINMKLNASAVNEAGAVTGTTSGKISNVTVINSYVSAIRAGGIAGGVYNGEITNSAFIGAEAELSATSVAGGIAARIGRDASGAITVKNNYVSLNAMTISGSSTTYVGGIVGNMYGSTKVLNLTNNYFVGELTFAATSAGGIVGGGYTAVAGDTLGNLYYDSTRLGGVTQAIAGLADTATVKGLTTSEMVRNSETEKGLAGVSGFNASPWTSKNPEIGRYFYPYLDTSTHAYVTNSNMPHAGVAQNTLQGRGTQADPYLIQSFDDLVFMSEAVNTSTAPPAGGNGYDYAYYKQTADIYQNTANFTPIGNLSVPFMGSYDGQGYSINNLTINANNASYVGMFGYVFVAEDTKVFKNLVFNNANVTSNGDNAYMAGVLIAQINFGSMYDGIISGIRVNNSSVTADRSNSTGSIHAGVIVGGAENRAKKLTISDCVVYNSNISASSNLHVYVGGIAGYTRSHTDITNCAVIGGTITSSTKTSTTGIASVGGLTSLTHESVQTYGTVTIENCYVNSDIVVNSLGNIRAGGILAFSAPASALNSQIIKNVWFAGTITGSVAPLNDYRGNIFGQVGETNSVYLENVYWDKSLNNYGAYSGLGTPAGLSNVAGLSTADMVKTDASAGLSGTAPFNAAPWSTSVSTPINGRYYYPYLTGGVHDTLTMNERPWTENPFNVSVDPVFAGNGTDSDPFLIYSFDDLLRLSTVVNTDKTYGASLLYKDASYKVMNDIYASGNFILISNSVERIFTGNFDGNGKSINNLNITGTMVSGLFGYAGEGAEITNLTLNNIRLSSTSGSAELGAVTGYSIDAILIKGVNVNNLNITSSVSGHNMRVGGLIGQAWSPSGIDQGPVIEDCNVNNFVANAVHTSTTNVYVGGLVGEVSHNSDSYTKLYIKNSSVTGNTVLSTNGGAGGILGYTKSQSDNSDIRIYNSYSTAQLNGEVASGGIVGVTVYFASIIVENSYFLGKAGTSASIGGVIGHVGTVANTTLTFNNVFFASDMLGTDKIVGNLDNAAGMGATGLSSLEMAYQSVAKQGIYADFLANQIDGANPWSFKAANNGTYYLPYLSDAYIPSITSYFRGGDGSTQNPFEIWTYADLEMMSYLVNNQSAAYASKSYKLMADIYATGKFTPIGIIQDGFNGTFDGDDHSINNLYVSENAGTFNTNYSGLFATLGEFSTVKNLTFNNALIEINIPEENTAAAVLAGRSLGGLIENVVVYNSVVNINGGGENTRAAGIVGQAVIWVSNTTGGTVFNNVGVVNTSINNNAGTYAYAGGITSAVYSSKDVYNASGYSFEMKNVYVTGNTSIYVSPTSYNSVGGGFVGLTGSNDDSLVTKVLIENSYSTASISAKYGGGAITRVARGSGDVTVKNTYFAGSINSTLSGGLIAEITHGTVTIDNSYFATDLAGTTDMVGSGTSYTAINGSEGRLVSAMVNTSATDGAPNGLMTSLDSNVWTVTTAPSGNKRYLPHLKGTAGMAELDLQYRPYAITQFSVGSGTDADPYQIWTYDDLVLLAALVNGPEYSNYADKSYALMSDIYATPGHEWTSIGILGGTSFLGKFFGNGHSINNLYTNKADENIGLFGAAVGATITNFSIVDSTFISLADNWVSGGAVVASISGNSTVSDILVKNTVVSSESIKQANVRFHLGLALGAAQDLTTVSNITVVGGKVTGGNGAYPAVRGFVGGIVGYTNGRADKVTIANASVVGNAQLIGNHYIGGIVGGSSNALKITNAFSDAAITANTVSSGFGGAGGIYGHDWTSGQIEIENTYFAGTIAAANTVRTGGTVGYIEFSATTLSITNSFFAKDVIGIDGASVVGQSASTPSIVNSEGLNAWDMVYRSATDKGINGRGFNVGYWAVRETANGIYYMPYLYFGANSFLNIDESLIPSYRPVFGGGDGATEATAFEIWDYSDLKLMSERVNSGNAAYSGKYWKLMANIYATDSDFTPIGLELKPFIGYFDGQNFSINNLKVNVIHTEDNHTMAGLFASIGSSTIKNFTIKNAEIFAENTITSNKTTVAGALAGSCNNSTIDNVTVADSKITGKSTNFQAQAGGLLGANGASANNQNNLITNVAILGCEINVDSGGPNPSSGAGGIIGYSNGAVSIDKAFVDAHTKVNGKLHAGGILGGLNVDQGDHIFRNVYSAAALSTLDSVSNAGGLVGIAFGSLTTLNITDSYFVTPIANASRVGGLIGYAPNIPNANATNVYFATDIAGTDKIIGEAHASASVTGVTGMLSKNMVYKNSADTGIWQYFENLTDTPWSYRAYSGTGNVYYLPYLTQFGQESAPAIRIPAFEGGQGTANRPFEIWTYDDLVTMSGFVNSGATYTVNSVVRSYAEASYILMADITAPAGSNFVPIGNEGNTFKGNFNGNNKVIRNLNVDATSDNWLAVGLFGRVSGGRLYNFSVHNASISGVNTAGNNVVIGVIAGRLEGVNSEVEISNVSAYNSTVTAKTATGNAINIGGLVGVVDGWTYAYGVTIKDSHAVNLTVTADNTSAAASVPNNGGINIGGLIGFVQGVVVANCSVTGTESSVNITDTTNTGGVLRAGGAFGRIYDVTVDNIFVNTEINAAGMGSASNMFVGGLAGLTNGYNNYMHVKNSYFAGTLNATADYTKGALMGQSSNINHFVLENVFWANDFDGMSGLAAIGSGSATSTRNVYGMGAMSMVYQNETSRGVIDLFEYFGAEQSPWAATAPQLGARSVYYFPHIAASGLATEYRPSYTIPEDLAGSGTVTDPFLIETYADLVRMSELVNSGATIGATADLYASAYYKLVNDITAPAGSRFTPIGLSGNYNGAQYSMPFRGVFDGNNKSLNSIYVYEDNSTHAGIFAYCNDATIKDLTVNDAYVYGAVLSNANHVGVLAGSFSGLAANIRINNSYAEAGPTGYATRLGGFTGLVSRGTLENITVYNTVINNSNTVQLGYADIVGGIVGISFYNPSDTTSTLTIKNVAFIGSEGKIISKNGGEVGGLIGNTSWTVGASYTMENVYSTADIEVDSVYLAKVGGLIGNMRANNIESFNINRGYFAGTIKSVGINYGDAGNSLQNGIVGYVSGTASKIRLSNLFYDQSRINTKNIDQSTNTLKAYSAHLITGGSVENIMTNVMGLSTSEMASHYTNGGVDYGKLWDVYGFNGTNGWSIHTPDASKEGYYFYPYLTFSDLPVSEQPAVTNPPLQGEGTAQNPFIIKDYTDLKTASEMINNSEGLYKASHYALAANISANAARAATEYFTPMGTAAQPFEGTFDGRGYSISGIVVNTNMMDSADRAYTGLFGHTKGATIKNLAVRGIKIENVSGGSNVYAGGLIGYAEGTSVTDVTMFSPKVLNDTSTTSYSGGLIGYAANGLSVSGASVVGENAEVYGKYYAAGLIGYVKRGDMTRSVTNGNAAVYDSMAYATVYHTGNTGAAAGLIGGIEGYANLFNFERAYFSGTITSSVAKYGVIGYVQDTMALYTLKSLIYNREELTGVSAVPAGITGTDVKGLNESEMAYEADEAGKRGLLGYFTESNKWTAFEEMPEMYRYMPNLLNSHNITRDDVPKLRLIIRLDVIWDINNITETEYDAVGGSVNSFDFTLAEEHSGDPVDKTQFALSIELYYSERPNLTGSKVDSGLYYDAGYYTVRINPFNDGRYAIYTEQEYKFTVIPKEIELEAADPAAYANIQIDKFYDTTKDIRLSSGQTLADLFKQYTSGATEYHYIVKNLIGSDIVTLDFGAGNTGAQYLSEAVGESKTIVLGNLTSSNKNYRFAEGATLQLTEAGAIDAYELQLVAGTNPDDIVKTYNGLNTVTDLTQFILGNHYTIQKASGMPDINIDFSKLALDTFKAIMLGSVNANQVGEAKKNVEISNAVVKYLNVTDANFRVVGELVIPEVGVINKAEVRISANSNISASDRITMEYWRSSSFLAETYGQLKIDKHFTFTGMTVADMDALRTIMSNTPDADLFGFSNGKFEGRDANEISNLYYIDVTFASINWALTNDLGKNYNVISSDIRLRKAGQILPRGIRVEAVSSVSVNKEYDGNDTLTKSIDGAYRFVDGDVLPGDNITIAYDSGYYLGGANASAANKGIKLVNPVPYGDNAHNYTIKSVVDMPGGGQESSFVLYGTIQHKAITLRIKDNVIGQSKEYDGTTAYEHVLGDIYEVLDAANGETVAVNFAPVYSSKDAGANVPVMLNPSLPSNTNYRFANDVTSMSIPASISKRILNMADNTSESNKISREYDGTRGFTPDSGFMWTDYVTFDRVLAGDLGKLNFTATGMFNDATVLGANTLTLTRTGDSLIGEASTNYAINPSDTTLTLAYAAIAPRELTVGKGTMGVIAKDFDFGYSVLDTVDFGGAYILGNFVGSDGNGIRLGVAGEYLSGGSRVSNAGSGYDIMLIFDGTLIGDASLVSNYRVDLDKLNDGTFLFSDAGIINQRKLGVVEFQGNDVIKKIYDGTTAPAGGAVQAGVHFKFDYEIPESYYANFQVTTDGTEHFLSKDVKYTDNKFNFRITGLTDSEGNFVIDPDTINRQVSTAAEILPAPLYFEEKTTADTIDKKYDGTSDVTALQAYLAGFYTLKGAAVGETLNVNMRGTYMNGADAAVFGSGLDVLLYVNTGDITGADMDNYIYVTDGQGISLKLIAKGNITEAALTIEQTQQNADNPISKVYDGTNALKAGDELRYLTNFIFNGVSAADAAGLSVTFGTVEYKSKNVLLDGDRKNINKIVFTITEVTGTNVHLYDFASIYGITFEIDGEITPRELRVEYDTANTDLFRATKTYDGTTQVNGYSNDTLKGLLVIEGTLSGENVTIANTFRVVYDNNGDAGIRNLIFSNLSVDYGGANADNYTIAENHPDVTALNRGYIEKLSITASVNSSWTGEKEYDGKNTVSIGDVDDLIDLNLGVNIPGYTKGDLRLANKQVTGGYELEGTIAEKNYIANNYQDVNFLFNGSSTYYLIDKDGNVANNYEISALQTELKIADAFFVKQRVLTAEVRSTSDTYSKVYDTTRTADAAELETRNKYFVLTNTVTGETVTLRVGEATFDNANAGVQRVELKNLTLEGATAGNYRIDNFKIAAEIKQKLLGGQNANEGPGEIIGDPDKPLTKSYDGTTDASPNLTAEDVADLFSFVYYGGPTHLRIVSFTAVYGTANATDRTTVSIREIVLNDSNYAIGEIIAVGKIERAKVRVEPNEGFVISGTKMPSFQYTASGKPAKGADLVGELYLIKANGDRLVDTNTPGMYSFGHSFTAISNPNYDITVASGVYEVRTGKLTEDDESNSNNSEVEVSNSSGYADGSGMTVMYLSKTASSSFHEDIEEEGKFLGAYSVKFYRYVNGGKQDYMPEGVMTVKFKLSSSMLKAKDLNIIVVENGIKRLIDSITRDDQGYVSFTTRGISEFGVFDGAGLSPWEKNMGLWIGLIAGGVALIILLFLLIWLYKRNKAKKNERLAGYRPAYGYGLPGARPLGINGPAPLGLAGNVAATSTGKGKKPVVPRNAKGQKVDAKGRPLQEAKVLDTKKAGEQKKTSPAKKPTTGKPAQGGKKPAAQRQSPKKTEGGPKKPEGPKKTEGSKKPEGPKKN